MTRFTLPILLPGRTESVPVPCALPESFDFRVFLPSRGVRTFTAWLTSTDPRTAEVADVQIANREGDPRASLSYEVDDDEQERADEAAGGVLVELFNALGIHYATRLPMAMSPLLGGPCRAAVLHAIATAWLAEELAVERQTQLCHALEAAGLKDASRDAYALVPDLASDRAQEKSPTLEALRGYVEHALERAVLAQSDKADAQLAEHARTVASDEDEAGSERIRAPRHLDVPTLKALSLDIPY